MWSMHTWESAWTVLIIVFCGGLVAGKITERPRIPDVAGYLLLGLLLGPAVLHWVAEPIRSQANQFIMNLGATLILFEGGREVQMRVLRQVWLSISLLATLGVFVSAGVLAIAVHAVFGAPWAVSLLAGAVLAPTDPATLIPVFRRVRIVSRLQQTVESESAFNDATGAVLVFTLLSILGHRHAAPVWVPIGAFVHAAGLGLAAGVVCGTFALALVSRRAFGVFHEYGSVVMLVCALGAYAGAEALSASGLMAAFVAGVITGNGDAFGWPVDQHTEDNIRHFSRAITLLFRMLIFVLLGTQVDVGAIAANAWPCIIVIAVLMFVARPLSVLACVLVDRRANWRWREVLFMMWVRETGVIPAALSGMLVALGVPGSQTVRALTFCAIVCTVLLQATSTGWVARRLSLLRPPESEDV